MHRYEASVLSALKKKHSMSLEELASASGLGRDEVLWAIENLSESAYLDVKKVQAHTIALSREGQSYASAMLPEEQLLKELKIHTLKAGPLQRATDRAPVVHQAGFCNGQRRNHKNHTAGEGTARCPPTKALFSKSLSNDPDSYPRLSKTQLSELDTLSKRSLITIKERSQVEGITITPKGLEK